MFEIAEKLSEGFKFVRIDLYCSNGNIYFGEFTLYPATDLIQIDCPKQIKCLGSKLIYNYEEKKL